uniref:Basal-body rod modification protein FlgD n=1 Tax=Phenylobacterium glaciei TaxID=2803784 RepID=A0A974P339_9CAUL|nr:hypothetical protein JKL49_21590 [Phenylobacterium glaciei]
MQSPAPPTTTQTGTKRLAESFDTFLNLLTTQLKNQDPLSPWTPTSSPSSSSR